MNPYLIIKPALMEHERQERERKEREEAARQRIEERCHWWDNLHGDQCVLTEGHAGEHRSPWESKP